MPFIDIQDFSYTYPGETSPTLCKICLSIEQGAFLVVTGKSGSGKSTLGKALAGFLFQDEEPNFSGQILVNHVNMTQLSLSDASEKVAYVQQNPEDQFCTLTVMDEIAFGLENMCFAPAEIDKQIDKVLSIVNGDELRGRFLASLSGGEKQKVAIASMLALSPDVLILDEPTSNLDPQATESIFKTLSSLCLEKDLTIIIIEHKLSQLESFNHECLTLEDGKILASENLKGYQTNPADIVFSFPKSPRLIFPSYDNLLDLKDVSVDHVGKRILTNINFQVTPGEFIALMGPNGSGKTTLLETMIGFHDCQRGMITAFGSEDTKFRTSALVHNIGYIFQNPDHQLFTQSVWEEAVFTAINLKCLDDERQSLAEELLYQMGFIVHKDTHPQRLSYGEKRRLNLISAMLHGPRLLLIDELLIGQDMVNAQIWMSFLHKFTRLGNSVILVNHHAELSQDYCDRVVFIANGHILIDLPIPDAFDSLKASGYTAFLPKDKKERLYE